MIVDSWRWIQNSLSMLRRPLRKLTHVNATAPACEHLSEVLRRECFDCRNFHCRKPGSHYCGHRCMCVGNHRFKSFGSRFILAIGMCNHFFSLFILPEINQCAVEDRFHSLFVAATLLTCEYRLTASFRCSMKQFSIHSIVFLLQALIGIANMWNYDFLLIIVNETLQALYSLWFLISFFSLSNIFLVSFSVKNCIKEMFITSNIICF